MLDINTLSELKDLMAKTLYSAEVNRLPKLSRAEERELVVRARRHDPVARAQLIVSCLAYAWSVAVILFLTYRPEHEDVLDFVQVASEAMLKALDNALFKKANPASYLRAVAKRAMAAHLFYYSDLIRKPHFRRAELATKQIPTVESLDIPAFREGATLRIDLVEAPPPSAETQKRFEPLYEGLQQLTPIQRNSIAARYRVGLIDPTVQVEDVRQHTLAKLRKALDPHLKRMLE